MEIKLQVELEEKRKKALNLQKVFRKGRRLGEKPYFFWIVMCPIPCSTFFF